MDFSNQNRKKKLILTVLFLALLIHSCKESPIRWWKKFVRNTDSNFNFGTKGVQHENNLPKVRAFHGYCSFNDDQRYFYVFGGTQTSSEDENFNDLWRYDVLLDEWMFMYGNKTINVHGSYFSNEEVFPGSRFNMHIACYTSPINGDKKIVLVAGFGNTGTPSDEGLLNDIWSFSITSGKWEWISGSNQKDQAYSLGSKNSWGDYSIGGLERYSLIPFDQNQTLFFFGGGVPNINGYCYNQNHVFLYNVENNNFLWLRGKDDMTCPMTGNYDVKGTYDSNIYPGGRTSSAGWKINEEEAYIFGGSGWDMSGSGNYLNDLWLFHIPSARWKYISGDKTWVFTNKDYYSNGWGEPFYNATIPNTKYNHVTFFYNGNIYLLGGSTGILSVSSDLIMYSLDEKQWYLLSENSFLDSYTYIEKMDYSKFNVLGGIYGHSGMLMVDERDDIEILLFGGIIISEYEKDVVSNIVTLHRRIFSCEGMDEDEIDVCNSNGRCTNFNECTCNDGIFGQTCTVSKCGDKYSNDTEVCDNRGFCERTKCICVPNFIGSDCEIPICNGKMGNSSDVCSSQGVCEKNNKCKCNNGWMGDLCGERNLFFLVAVDYWFIPVLIILSLFVLIVLIVCIICITGIIIGKQRKIIKKIDGIDDFDILLEERKLEKDLSIAHLKINKKLFEINFEKDVKLLEIIGRGGSECDVFLVEWKGQKAAFKSFRRSNLFVETQENFEEFEREVEILASVSHPNILRFYGAVLSTKKIGYLMEYAKEGELGSFLLRFSKKNGFKYPISEKIRLLTEISQGMNHIHELNIIHRDLKPENVLIMDKTLTAKIMDFGGSKIIQNEDNENTRRVGTSYYMSPEVFSGTNYNSKCDVYSFGILMFVVFSEKLSPFGMNSNDVELKVSQDKTFRPKIEKESFKGVKEGIISLMKQCWDHDSKKKTNF